MLSRRWLRRAGWGAGFLLIAAGLSLQSSPLSRQAAEADLKNAVQAPVMVARTDGVNQIGQWRPPPRRLVAGSDPDLIQPRDPSRQALPQVAEAPAVAAVEGDHPRRLRLRPSPIGPPSRVLPAA